MDDNAEFLSKLRQIEEVAYIVAAALEDTGLKAHLRHIALLTKALQSRLEMGAVAVVDRKLLMDGVKKPPA